MPFFIHFVPSSRSHPVITVVHCFWVCIKCVKSPTSSAPGFDYWLFLFVPCWIGFEVLLWNVWVGEEKKVFSVLKNDNLSFFSLGSQPVEMDLLPAVSLSVSRNVFFIVSHWGQAAGTTSWPAPAAVSVPIRFPPIFQLLSQFSRSLSPWHFEVEGEEHSVHILFHLQILHCWWKTEQLWNTGKWLSYWHRTHHRVTQGEAKLFFLLMMSALPLF